MLTEEQAGEATPAPPVADRRLLRRQRRSRWDLKLSPYLYISPFFVLFVLVGLYPLLYTGWLSLHDWDRLYYQQGEFSGLENYRFVLTDPVFIKSLVNTFSIFLMSSVPQVIVAVCVAALLDTHLRGRTFWRMSVLLPFVVAPAAAVLIFGSLFADKSGLINAMLDGVGLEPIRWHVDRWWSHFAIASMVNWRWTGYNALIFLAAMQAVPRDLYESAAIDGAGRVRQFWSVTLPMIRPTMIFVIVTSTIGGLQIFTEPRLFDDTPQPRGRRRPPVHDDDALHLRQGHRGPVLRPRLGRGLDPVHDHHRDRAAQLRRDPPASPAGATHERRSAAMRRPGFVVYGLLAAFVIGSALPLYWSFMIGSHTKADAAQKPPPAAAGRPLHRQREARLRHGRLLAGADQQRARLRRLRPPRWCSSRRSPATASRSSGSAGARCSWASS